MMKDIANKECTLHKGSCRIPAGTIYNNDVRNETIHDYRYCYRLFIIGSYTTVCGGKQESTREV